MKRLVAFAAVLAVALVLIATPGFAVAGVTGVATTDNTILSAKVGNTLAKLGVDLADVLNGSTIKATSRLITGQVAGLQLPGGLTRTATRSSESGSDSAGTGTKSIAGLASLNITGGSIATTVSSTRVASAVDFAAGALNALGGFTNIATMNSHTNASVDSDSSAVERLVTIGDVDILDLRTLLDQLGIDPLAIACGAVSSVGSALGVDTSAACSALDAVDVPGGGEIPDALGTIDSTETVMGTLETLLAPLCALAPAGTCTTITSQIAGLQSQIDGFQASPPDVCATVSDALNTVSGQLDTIISTLGVLNVDGLLGSLDAIIAPVVGQVGGVDSAQSQLDAACNTLLGIVDGILDTPLLFLDGIQVGMDLKADSTPTSSATGSIGALKVGNLTVVSADDLVALGAQLQSAIDTVKGQLGTVFSALGLSGLPSPAVNLLKVTTDKGKLANGTYFAKAAMTAASVYIPSAVVDLPATLPLDVLSGLGGFAPAAVSVAAVTTPTVSVQAGVFSGQATYKAGAVLPVTGLSTTGLILTGILSLAGATVLRRVVKTFN